MKNLYEQWQERMRLQEHYPHGQAHDQSTHYLRYGRKRSPDTAAGRARAMTKETKDRIDDTGEYIVITDAETGDKISFVNWDDAEDYERDVLYKRANPGTTDIQHKIQGELDSPDHLDSEPMAEVPVKKAYVPSDQEQQQEYEEQDSYEDWLQQQEKEEYAEDESYEDWQQQKEKEEYEQYQQEHAEDQSYEEWQKEKEKEQYEQSQEEHAKDEEWEEYLRELEKQEQIEQEAYEDWEQNFNKEMAEADAEYKAWKIQQEKMMAMTASEIKDQKQYNAWKMQFEKQMAMKDAEYTAWKREQEKLHEQERLEEKRKAEQRRFKAEWDMRIAKQEARKEWLASEGGWMPYLVDGQKMTKRQYQRMQDEKKARRQADEDRQMAIEDRKRAIARQEQQDKEAKQAREQQAEQERKAAEAEQSDRRKQAVRELAELGYTINPYGSYNVGTRMFTDPEEALEYALGQQATQKSLQKSADEPYNWWDQPEDTEYSYYYQPPEEASAELQSRPPEEAYLYEPSYESGSSPAGVADVSSPEIVGTAGGGGLPSSTGIGLSPNKSDEPHKRNKPRQPVRLGPSKAKLQAEQRDEMAAQARAQSAVEELASRLGLEVTRKGPFIAVGGRQYGTWEQAAQALAKKYQRENPQMMQKSVTKALGDEPMAGDPVQQMLQLSADKQYQVQPSPEGGVMVSAPDGSVFTFDTPEEALEYLNMAPAMPAPGVPSESPTHMQYDTDMVAPAGELIPPDLGDWPGDESAAPAQLWYPNAIQPPTIPEGDPEYKDAEHSAKSAIEDKMTELGGAIRGEIPGFKLVLPEHYMPQESPEFTSWQQAQEWLGVQAPKVPMPLQESARQLRYIEYVRLKEGGEGSGNFDHAGRPGQVGGSAPRSGGKDSGSAPKKSPKTKGGHESAGSDKGKHWDDYLPIWYGGPYSTLMRQYILGYPRKPPEYPAFNDLTETQQAKLEDMIANQNVLLKGAKDVMNTVLVPAAKGVSDAIDYITYDAQGRRIQNYANSALYYLGIAARHKVGTQIAEKIAEENKDIEFYNKNQAEIAGRMPTGWADKQTGEVITFDDPRVPKMSDAAKLFQADEIQREKSMEHNKAWNQLSPQQRQAWDDLAQEDWFQEKHTKKTDGTLPWKDGRDLFQQRKKAYQRWVDRVANLSEEEQLNELRPKKPKVVHPELEDYRAKFAAWENSHDIERATAKFKSLKEMPRWLQPKTPHGKALSYAFNPFSLGLNIAGSMFMAYALPAVSRQLKKYAAGDPRAFSYWLDSYLEEEPLKESFWRFLEADESPPDKSPQAAIAAIQQTLQDEDGPVPQVFGPMLTDKIMAAMQKLSEEEQGKVIALFGALGEAHITSLADDGKPLPLDDNGYPMLPLEEQQALQLSDAERERFTPIAMLIATLGGMEGGWFAFGSDEQAALKEAAAEDEELDDAEPEPDLAPEPTPEPEPTPGEAGSSQLSTIQPPGDIDETGTAETGNTTAVPGGSAPSEAALRPAEQRLSAMGYTHMANGYWKPPESLLGYAPVYRIINDGETAQPVTPVGISGGGGGGAGGAIGGGRTAAGGSRAGGGGGQSGSRPTAGDLYAMQAQRAAQAKRDWEAYDQYQEQVKAAKRSRSRAISNAKKARNRALQDWSEQMYRQVGGSEPSTMHELILPDQDFGEPPKLMSYAEFMQQRRGGA